MIPYFVCASSVIKALVFESYIVLHFKKHCATLNIRKSTHSKVDAPEMVECPYGHRLSCGSDRIGIFIAR